MTLVQRFPFETRLVYEDAYRFVLYAYGPFLADSVGGVV